jgi:hypothetical protein
MNEPIHDLDRAPPDDPRELVGVVTWTPLDDPKSFRRFRFRLVPTACAIDAPAPARDDARERRRSPR